jgi:hypothetical protein
MDEETIEILGIVIPNESPLFIAIVAVHVAIALVAVTAGIIAMLAPKGVGRHSKFGSVYYWAMAGVFVTATALAVMRWTHSRHLFVLGTLAFACATLGRRSAGRKPPRLDTHLLGMGASYVILLTAFYVDNGKNLPLWKELPAIAYWTVPALFGVPIIVRTWQRHPLLRRARPAPRGRPPGK